MSRTYGEAVDDLEKAIDDLKQEMTKVVPFWPLLRVLCTTGRRVGRFWCRLGIHDVGCGH